MSLSESWSKAAARAVTDGVLASRENVVIDTNAFLSALISPSGTVAQAIDSAILHANIIQSDETLAELGAKLASKRLAKFISEESRTGMLELVTELCTRIEAPHITDVCRDPKDNMFLDLAHAGGARSIVSGDNDLRDLKTFPGEGYTINIISPREYLDANPLPEAPQGVFYRPKPQPAQLS